MRTCLTGLLLLLSCAHAPPSPRSAPRFSITLPLATGPLDGRLLLFLSTDGKTEPRDQLADADSTAQLFGVDVDALQPGGAISLDDGVLGYPVQSLAQVPTGDYFVQGVFHLYQTFHRGDGHTVKLPADRGEGQQWRTAPGNFFSAPRRLRVAPGETVRLALDQVNPPLPAPPLDTKYVKHLRLQSERLSRFWGRPTYLGAIVLLPEGYDTHPNARYPLVVSHGHFARTLEVFRETPPDPALPPLDLPGLLRTCPNGHEGAACTEHGLDRLEQETAHALYKEWTGPGFPRAVVVSIQHANPYYDDSYAVNSENMGPYGDAIAEELIPFLEQQLRLLGPWARGLYGGSTGGWEALATQLLHPDQYNGAIVSCPDPIDFSRFTVIDLYQDANAYDSIGAWKRTPRPAERGDQGQVRATIEQSNLRELVLGTHSRSGDQWDAWEAVYSPVGSDGYPKRIWDKRTGLIDPAVAAHWRAQFDLARILQRDWATLGPKLRGKLTINVGRADNFFLDGAVTRVEELLRSIQDPPSDARFDYGASDEHCWSGDHEHANVISRLTYTQRFVPQLAAHWLATAPPGADTKSWRY